MSKIGGKNRMNMMKMMKMKIKMKMEMMKMKNEKLKTGRCAKIAIFEIIISQ